MRDHAIGPPVPQATVRFGIPNACDGCHAGRGARWAAGVVRSWRADGSGARLLRRADAFVGGRKGDPSALPLLAALAADAAEPALVRANAVGHLRRYPDPAAFAAAARALSDPSPVVRAVAALTLSEAGAGAGPAPALVSGVSDRRAIVRVAAAFALMSRGVRELPGDAAGAYEAAKAEYVRRAALLADDRARSSRSGSSCSWTAGSPPPPPPSRARCASARTSPARATCSRSRAWAKAARPRRGGYWGRCRTGIPTRRRRARWRRNCRSPEDQCLATEVL
jgi:hypothetical protein